LEASEEEPMSTLTVNFGCNCGEAHEGQPDSPKGCGRSWTLSALVGDDDTVALLPVDDPHLAEAAQALREAQTGQVTRIRTGAEKWIAAIGALTGLFGVIGLGLATEDIRALATASRVAVVVAVGVAGLAAASAILLSYGAAYGWPRTRSVADDDELLAWYTGQIDEAARIGSRLRAAAVAVCVALLALLAAAAFTWVLPTAPAGGSLVKISVSDQSIHCGDLLASGGDGVLRIRRADSGAVEVVPVAEVVQLTPVEKC
jgi:hypothetical protein